MNRTLVVMVTINSSVAAIGVVVHFSWWLYEYCKVGSIGYALGCVQIHETADESGYTLESLSVLYIYAW